MEAIFLLLFRFFSFFFKKKGETHINCVKEKVIITETHEIQAI